MTEQLQISVALPVAPERIYRAWLDSTEHSAMTGGEAVIQPLVGGRHSAWDGYIEGENLVLEPSRRIVQTWRTTEFEASAPDSRLEVVLERTDEGSRVTLLHSNLPEGSRERYRDGWQQFYFDPMKRYFSADAIPPEADLEPAQDVWDGSRTMQTPQDSLAGLAPTEVRLWDNPPEDRKSELAMVPKAPPPADPISEGDDDATTAPSDEVSVPGAYYGSPEDLERAMGEPEEPLTRRTSPPPSKVPARKKAAPKPVAKKAAPKKAAPKKAEPVEVKPEVAKAAAPKKAAKKAAPKKAAPKKAAKKAAPKKAAKKAAPKKAAKKAAPKKAAKKAAPKKAAKKRPPRRPPRGSPGRSPPRRQGSGVASDGGARASGPTRAPRRERSHDRKLRRGDLEPDSGKPAIRPDDLGRAGA